MDVGFAVLYALAFPGLLFLVGYSLFLQYVDRKVVARIQSRVGPPLLQPFADLVKLLSKEDITPEGVDARVARAIPLLAFAAVATAFLYVPVVGPTPFGFQGDLVVVLYLLTLPTVLLFLAGWTSRNVFAAMGGVRAVTQLFIYEVPFFLALLGPALAAGTWSINDILGWQAAHAWVVLFQPIGFVVALVALQAKLERAPFDIPEAETELIAGPWTELTGRKLAVMRLSIDMSLVAGAGLIAALFLGGPALPGLSLSGWVGGIVGFVAFLGKTFGILLLLAGIRSATGRIRIDQLNRFGWKWMAGAALVQVLLVLLLGPRGVAG
jgi:NADH-quinone oxidoreductase subunit H